MEWGERPGLVELSPSLSSPNQTCTFQRIQLSIQACLKQTPRWVTAWLEELDVIEHVGSGLGSHAVSLLAAPSILIEKKKLFIAA